MHLLFVSSLVPVANPSSGFGIANRAVLDGLVALGHRVSVVGYIEPGQTPAQEGPTHLLGEVELTNARVGAVTKLGWLLTALMKRTSLSSAKMLKVSAERIETLLAELQPFDGIILNSVQLPAAFASVFQKYPTIYVAHNVEAEAALANAERAGGRIERALFFREARYLEQYERQLTQAASHIWTFAEGDRFGFGYLMSDKASVLPLVTQWEAPAPLPAPRPQYDIGLIGTWSWKPNRIGLDWFLSRVVPQLAPDVTIAIAGQLAGTPAVSHPGVTFLGRVPDAHAFAASCGVIPLIAKSGSGVQLKTIEAFELGLATVATRQSLRGIDVIPSNCSIADQDAEFARLLTERVADLRAGESLRVSGALFHHAQKSRLLETLQEGLASLGREASQAKPPATGQPAAKERFAVHEGGKAR
ncbi:MULTISPECIES: glycosyltransferase family 4 protein [unclassified Rhizobium]|uniref:glycosyltransferase n=1 Tax=unclassified Rhizobium TaxID=2613769 RepID=UPI000701774B|nr:MULTISPECIES: glycosyltransferase family 4 protein [unclassified Rhizobium]KQV43865.1 hypothetical protein ASC86_03465 [Rhizobium sp. Root1212]KRD38047.1 hypothetical protein ASE37_03465 [Rhizobium sp. Root268]